PVSRTTPTLLFVVAVFSPLILVSISSSILLMDFDLLKLLLESFEPIANTPIPNVATDPNAHPTKKLGIDHEFSRQVGAISLLQILDDLRSGFAVDLASGLDSGLAFFHFESQQTPVLFQTIDVLPRLSLAERADRGPHS